MVGGMCGCSRWRLSGGGGGGLVLREGHGAGHQPSHLTRTKSMMGSSYLSWCPLTGPRPCCTSVVSNNGAVD